LKDLITSILKFIKCFLQLKIYLMFCNINLRLVNIRKILIGAIVTYSDLFKRKARRASGVLYRKLLTTLN